MVLYRIAGDVLHHVIVYRGVSYPIFVLYRIVLSCMLLYYIVGAWRAKREVVSFRVVRACARCLCEVRSG